MNKRKNTMYKRIVMHNSLVFFLEISQILNDAGIEYERKIEEWLLPAGRGYERYELPQRFSIIEFNTPEDYIIGKMALEQYKHLFIEERNNFSITNKNHVL